MRKSRKTLKVEALIASQPKQEEIRLESPSQTSQLNKEIWCAAMVPLPKAVLKNYVQVISMNLREGSWWESREKADLRTLPGELWAMEKDSKKLLNIWGNDTTMETRRPRHKAFHLLRLKQHLGPQICWSRMYTVLRKPGPSPRLTMSFIFCILMLWHLGPCCLWKDRWANSQGEKTTPECASQRQTDQPTAHTPNHLPHQVLTLQASTPVLIPQGQALGPRACPNGSH